MMNRIGWFALLERLRSAAAGFREARQGVAATEFALILPVMILMYLGTVEVTQGIQAKRRVNMLARTLSDLTSQSANLSSTGLDAIFDAATVVMAPLNILPLKMRVSSVIIAPDGRTCVDWSFSKPAGDIHAVGSPVTLPTGLVDPDATGWQSIVMAEVSYGYTPVTAYVITGTITISDSPAYMRPRASTRVTIDGVPDGCAYITNVTS
jgi:Flp pilus assembly protein TadG